jgi:hypothetical protein
MEIPRTVAPKGVLIFFITTLRKIKRVKLKFS